MTILVTGAAGFIGHAVTVALLARGEEVIGVDELNDYYSVNLKLARLASIDERDRFQFIQVDFSDLAALTTALGNRTIDRIVHLGAQAGVRYSLENPHAYVRSNLAGHANLLEFARHRAVTHMVYASSSSVYGGNQKFPFAVGDAIDRPISFYAATKRSNELMSETYSHLFRIPLTGLRFFTVYGPWGRPDMAAWLFTEAIAARRPIRLFANGELRRDFTYIDDIVAGVIAAIDHPPADDGLAKPGGGVSPHAVYNLGNSRPEVVNDLVATIERALGVPAIREVVAMQPGDVEATFADIEVTTRDLGWKPTTHLHDGIQRFVEWYRHWNKYSTT